MSFSRNFIHFEFRGNTEKHLTRRIINKTHAITHCNVFSYSWMHLICIPRLITWPSSLLNFDTFYRFCSEFGCNTSCCLNAVAVSLCWIWISFCSELEVDLAKSFPYQVIWLLFDSKMWTSTPSATFQIIFASSISIPSPLPSRYNADQSNESTKCNENEKWNASPNAHVTE